MMERVRPTSLVGRKMSFLELARRVVAPKAGTSELGELVPTLNQFSALTIATALNGEQFPPHLMRSVNFSPQRTIHMCAVMAVVRGTQSPPASEPCCLSSSLGSSHTCQSALLGSGVFDSCPRNCVVTGQPPSHPDSLHLGFYL